MRIDLDGVAVFSKEYESFDELSDDFIDYEDEQGRTVPNYDLGIMLGAIGLYLLKKTVDELIREARDRRQERINSEAARERSEEEERRHMDLLAKTDELIKAVQDAEEAQPQGTLLGPDAAVVSAFLHWARQEGVRIVVHLDTEAENDLKETFEALTTDVLDSEVNGPKPELEGDDSA